MNDVQGYRMNGGKWFVDKVWKVPGIDPHDPEFPHQLRKHLPHSS